MVLSLFVSRIIFMFFNGVVYGCALETTFNITWRLFKMGKYDELIEKVAADEKTVLEQLKEKTDEVWNASKKMIYGMIKEYLDDEDDDQVKLFKKLKKMINSCEELNDIAFNYMAEQDRKIDAIYKELNEINANTLNNVEETRNTNKLLRELIKK